MSRFYFIVFLFLVFSVKAQDSLGIKQKHYYVELSAGLEGCLDDPINHGTSNVFYGTSGYGTWWIKNYYEMHARIAWRIKHSRNETRQFFIAGSIGYAGFTLVHNLPVTSGSGVYSRPIYTPSSDRFEYFQNLIDAGIDLSYLRYLGKHFFFEHQLGVNYIFPFSGEGTNTYYIKYETSSTVYDMGPYTDTNYHFDLSFTPEYNFAIGVRLKSVGVFVKTRISVFNGSYSTPMIGVNAGLRYLF